MPDKSDPKLPEPEVKKPPEPKTPIAASAKKRGLYRPTRNWRYGYLYEEGKDYDMEGIPQETLDAAVEAGHLEEV